MPALISTNCSTDRGPKKIQQAQHNLDEARATLANDKLTLDRTKELAGGGVVSRQQLDDATAKFEV